MHRGPWLFRHHAMVIEEYTGICHPYNSARVWAQIMGRSDLLHNRVVAKAMASKTREVLDVELELNGVEYGCLFEYTSRSNWRSPL